MPQLRIVFLWHQHQPFYKDLVSGEYRLPWVRLHGLKDYYGMVKLLDEFPQVHQTFNLVPSLLYQLRDYVAGTASDPFLKVASRPPEELNDKDRRFALEYLFHANPTHLIGRYPRYRELWERYRGTGFDSARALPFFDTPDYADLQVLSQLAWFDEFFQDDREVAALAAKGRGFTSDDQKLVMAKQQQILAAIIPAHAAAAQKGQIEISTSAFYHPILPLLCDTNAGGISSPGLHLPERHFRHPEDAREQLQRGLDLHQSIFGMRPRGAWPSEGSVSDEVFRIAATLGLEWMATDEGVLARTLGLPLERDRDGLLAGTAGQRLYQAYRFEQGDTRLHLLFRDHTLSDLIGFVYAGMPAKEAAAHFIQSIKKSAEPVLRAGRDATVSIILDGENAWEFFPHSGREFLRRLYAAIQSDPVLQALTASQAIAAQKEFPVIASVVPGSWINANFNVWIGAPEDNRAWDYLSAARDFFAQAAPQASEAQRALAWEEILIAEGSDWNWWYGPEHHSANDRDFDELYRKHLTNVYQALGAAPPDYLAQPIAADAVRPTFVHQAAYIHPRIDSGFTRYFDWLGAAMYTADRHAGAMHGKQFLLDAIYAGIDESNLYGRVDPLMPFEEEYRLTVALEVHAPPPASSVRTLRLEVDVAPGAVKSWKLREGENPRQDAPSAGTAEARVVFNQGVRFLIPLAVLGAAPQSTLRLRFTLWRERLPLDALPVEGWMNLQVVSEIELEGSMYNYSASN